MLLSHIFLIYNFFEILLQECTGANILVYTPLPFYSHQSVYKPLWRELANKGHNITLLTLNPMQPQDNITQIDLSGVYKVLEKTKFFEVLSLGEQNFENIRYIFDTALEVAHYELSHPKVKDLINSNASFDLVLTEYYMTIGVAFAYKFKCPFIGFVSMDASADIHNAIGNPTHPILYPALDLGYIGNLNFRQRLVSTTFYLVWITYFKYSIQYKENKLIEKHFGNDFPSLQDMNPNASLVFINCNPLFHIQRPLNVQTINVGGGLHIQQPKPLPEAIQRYLDDAKEGVIYFSLGSSIRSSQISKNTKAAIIDTFSQLPYKVLWKFEIEQNDTMEFPANIYILKWTPQQDILRHRNVKLFITQGGLQSLEESLFMGVPVLVLPFYGDQVSNALRAVQYGFGLSLDHNKLTTLEFKATILELITSAKYRNTALKLAKQISDQPWTPLEKAVWWTEYVLRNPNVDILKHPTSSSLPLYQYYFLDLIAFVISLITGIVCFVFYVINFLFRSKRTKAKKE